MKKIRMFKAALCPHCNNASKWLEELFEENPKYKELDIQKIDIDEEKEKLVDVDFYYVPTFYADNKKVFEGAPTKEIVKKVLDDAL